MALHFAISEWSGWVQGSEETLAEGPHLHCSETPDVQTIPPMLRRRLNLLGRACVSEVMRHLDEQGDMPVVYCSQHGDIERTLSVLLELGNGEPVSPTQFSLAVHNAICGVLSIQTGNRGNVSALASGVEPVVPVLLEALGMLQAGERRVLCVICDVRLPDFYADPESQPQAPFAVSFVLSMDEGTALQLTRMDEVPETMTDYMPPARLIEFLDSTVSALNLTHNGCAWQLTRQTI